jgi:hypothetical protein
MRRIYIYICQCLKDVPHSEPDCGDLVIVCLKDINFQLNFDITDYLRGLYCNICIPHGQNMGQNHVKEANKFLQIVA